MVNVLNHDASHLIDLGLVIHTHLCVVPEFSVLHGLVSPKWPSAQLILGDTFPSFIFLLWIDSILLESKGKSIWWDNISRAIKSTEFCRELWDMSVKAELLALITNQLSVALFFSFFYLFFSLLLMVASSDKHNMITSGPHRSPLSQSWLGEGDCLLLSWALSGLGYSRLPQPGSSLILFLHIFSSSEITPISRLHISKPYQSASCRSVVDLSLPLMWLSVGHFSCGLWGRCTQVSLGMARMPF